MTADVLDAAGILTAVCDKARAAGGFVDVLDYEPKSAVAATGVTLAVWAGPIEPISSGLAATSVRFELTARCYRSMLAQPYTDTEILRAATRFVAGLLADFDLGGRLRAVDVQGAEGPALTILPGYVTLDSKLYRIAEVTLPLLINDFWTLTA